ncbi:hypothetical protein [Aliihoeflea sp. PC F10.4]
MIAFTLEEVAAKLSITSDDVPDPKRHVRHLIRRHAIPFVRCGRTVKLRQEQIVMLAEKMIENPCSFEPVAQPSPTERSGRRKRSTVPPVANPLARSSKRRSD